jgi:hypothetical protein
MGALLGAGALSFGYGLPAQAENDNPGLGNGGVDIKLATFDGIPSATRTWKVTSGASYDPLKSKTDLTFKGTLKKGKRITLATTDTKAFPDVSSCEGISLSVKETGLDASTANLFLGLGKDGKYQAKINPTDGFKEGVDYKSIEIPFTVFTDRSGGPPEAGFEKIAENVQTLTLSAEGDGTTFGLSVLFIEGYGCKKFDQVPADQMKLAVVDQRVEESSYTLSCVLAAGSAVLLALAVLHSRARTAPRASPLLG